jgi:tRNA1(Val) A37 N6-methylase TrmN6
VQKLRGMVSDESLALSQLSDELEITRVTLEKTASELALRRVEVSNLKNAVETKRQK